jgi:RimJ/RimL family protein N-acetyltransferase
VDEPELGSSRLIAATLTVNQGSPRVLEKAGPRYLRAIPADEHDTAEGAEHAVREYAVTRADWAALQP